MSGRGSGASSSVSRAAKAAENRRRSAGSPNRLARRASRPWSREPGGSEAGERIRALLLDPAARLDATTQIFLFCAARHDHVVALIEPALRRGAWVLCDRFLDSTRAYQGAAGELDAGLVRTLERAAVGATMPDLTIILDIDPAKGLARARRRMAEADAPDAFEAAAIGFHERVRQGYLAVAAEEPERCAVVPADRAEEAVAADIARIVRDRLGGGRADG